MNIEETVTEEIGALHSDLADWLSGRCGRDGGLFQTAFRDRFHADFFNVQPAGIVLDRAQLLDSLDNGYGRSPHFDIRIRGVIVRQAIDDGGPVLATYEEYQKGAQNSARGENARLSSVLFERAVDGRLIWRTIHETWLPEENHDPENFRF